MEDTKTACAVPPPDVLAGRERLYRVLLESILESFVNVLAEWRRLLTDFRPVAEQMEQDNREAPEAPHDTILEGDGFIRI